MAVVFGARPKGAFLSVQMRLTRVFCFSGGVTREWAGVPRRLFKPGTNDWRCACVKSSGAPLDDSLRDTNEGDLR